MFRRKWRYRRRGFFASASTFLHRLRFALCAFVLLLLADLVYVAGMSPDWDLYATGPVFKTSFMRDYEHERGRNAWPPLRWRPVALESVSPYVLRAVVVAEDSRFYSHKGFDQAAFEEAMEYNLSRRRLVYGASTISQQTVKNLFFRPTRNPLRKWHELLLTWEMEFRLDKDRILELYLNTAEFGLGIYGVEGAARAYWGISAAGLDLRQAAELAATLPAPKQHNPRTRTAFFEQRTSKLLGQLRRFGAEPSRRNGGQ
ncbi:MAG: monofunctional biosynthetic peptidoglycan transglycosylase [Myxococcota bacterium]